MTYQLPPRERVRYCIIANTQAPDWQYLMDYLAVAFVYDTAMDMEGKYLLVPFYALPRNFRQILPLMRNEDEGGAVYQKKIFDRMNPLDSIAVDEFVMIATLADFDLANPDGQPDTPQERATWWQRVRGALGL